ncbi:hypothetical protein AAE478_009293 [Parahypoxylon ruwenzoriense]
MTIKHCSKVLATSWSMTSRKTQNQLYAEQNHCPPERGLIYIARSTLLPRDEEGSTKGLHDKRWAATRCILYPSSPASAGSGVQIINEWRPVDPHPVTHKEFMRSGDPVCPVRGFLRIDL